MKSVITDGTIADGDIRLLLYWSRSRDIVAWSSNCLLYTFVSIRIRIRHLRRNMCPNLKKGEIFFIEEKKNGTLAVMVSSIVTAVTQKCCTPLSPSESTWHLRRSMCGGNSRRPTWKRNFQKKSPRSGLLGIQKKTATPFPWRKTLPPPFYDGKIHDTSSQTLVPFFDILLTVFSLLLLSFLNIIHQWAHLDMCKQLYYFYKSLKTNENKCLPFLTSFIIESQFRWIYKKNFDETNIAVHTDPNFQAASLSNAVNINISWF